MLNTFASASFVSWYEDNTRSSKTDNVIASDSEIGLEGVMLAIPASTAQPVCRCNADSHPTPHSTHVVGVALLAPCHQHPHAAMLKPYQNRLNTDEVYIQGLSVLQLRVTAPLVD